MLGALVPARARRPRRDDRRARRGLRGARAVVRVDRDDLRHAPDRGRLPGAPRPVLAVLSRLPRGARAARNGSSRRPRRKSASAATCGAASVRSSATARAFAITKRAPVISYGEEADDILLTARRAPDAAPADQVLVLVRKADTVLTRTRRLGHARHARHAQPGLHLEAVGVAGADRAGALRRHRQPDDAAGVARAVDVAVARPRQRRRRPRAGVRPRRGAAHAGHGAAGRAAAGRDGRRARDHARDRPRPGWPISSGTRTIPRRSPGSASRSA